MNGINGLPGFEGLLRGNKRLAAKLTSDEIRAIRDYLDDRIQQEQADVNFRLYALQNDFDVTVRRSSETITDLYQEVAEKKDIIKQYQESDQKIISVYKQKEQRWEKKQAMLMAEVTKTEGEKAKADSKLKETEEKLEAKTKEIEEIEQKLGKATEAVRLVNQAKQVLFQNDELKQDILKLKMEIDRKEKHVSHIEKEKKMLKADIEAMNNEKAANELKVANVQKELRKQMAEVAEKCKSLSETQFRLQLEQRQVEKLQKDLQGAKTDMENYRRILEEERTALNPNNAAVITLKKDLDIMDIRIKSLDISVRLRMDEFKRIEDRIDDIQAEITLANQLKNEVYLHGETYLEMTANELCKKLEFRYRRLVEEAKYAKDWEHPRREADIYRAEIAALMKQAAICKISELSSRAAKQLQKIDLIMRGTVGETTKMPKVFKVSERAHDKHQSIRTQHKVKNAFITSSTPVGGLSVTNVYRNSQRKGHHRDRHIRNSSLENSSDETKLQYIDTVELDLSRVSSATTRRSNAVLGASISDRSGPLISQSDRMTLKSVSTSNVNGLPD